MKLVEVGSLEVDVSQVQGDPLLQELNITKIVYIDGEGTDSSSGMKSVERTTANVCRKQDEQDETQDTDISNL